ncbi:nitrilase-related carbon-nitrogen hydrolase [Caballeronia sp. LP003]|uniref:nitrilase-related carbon-nitrogen hydrolase n=1 Tax=Caballeronia sp. LP003 TaxID=3038551 RepID=UPI00285B0CE3|nr:nitrilase-related carbon-nitrogen hydrolase [Caballeronia sp. LP003]MDR5791747.1 nitrilase-related carbon-nitrogen hydrolase [Caballeronia sp. LP003]
MDVARIHTSESTRATLRLHWLPSICIAALAGGVGYSGIGAWLCVAPLFAIAWGMTLTRRHAFLVAATYYAMAGRGLFHGGGVFFAGVDTPLSQSLPWGALVWLAPSLILALIWAACWSPKRLALRTLAALTIVSVPPFGLVGWANPLASAGFWFPAFSWAGLALMVSSFLALTHLGRAWATGGEGRGQWRWPAVLVGLSALSGFFANAVWTPPQHPTGWKAVQTHLSRADGWRALQAIQDGVALAVEQHARVVILPEAVGGDWELNKLFWADSIPLLKRKGVTVLIGAERPLDHRRSINALMTFGMEGEQEWSERVPVPLGMWNPLSSTRHIVADWGGSGVRLVAGKKVTYLICYEQLLMWPVLVSAMHGPQAIIGASNLWWASGTTIPGIQRSTLDSWGRLFDVPVLLATNS